MHCWWIQSQYWLCYYYVCLRKVDQRIKEFVLSGYADNTRLGQYLSTFRAQYYPLFPLQNDHITCSYLDWIRFICFWLRFLFWLKLIEVWLKLIQFSLKLIQFWLKLIHFWLKLIQFWLSWAQFEMNFQVWLPQNLLVHVVFCTCLKY